MCPLQPVGDHRRQSLHRQNGDARRSTVARESACARKTRMAMRLSKLVSLTTPACATRAALSAGNRPVFAVAKRTAQSGGPAVRRSGGPAQSRSPLGAAPGLPRVTRCSHLHGRPKLPRSASPAVRRSGGRPAAVEGHLGPEVRRSGGPDRVPRAPRGHRLGPEVRRSGGPAALPAAGGLVPCRDTRCDLADF